MPDICVPDPAPTGNQDAALKLMRKPFESHQISKMCKPTKKDNPPGRCPACNGWHKLPSVQLSYVGHAALTDRLLDADPHWSWEPMALSPTGTPLLDNDGGMWIKLTVAGVTRLGYGDAQGKMGGDAMKERIGDALRNAAMRFGAALDLWHKGDLHPEITEEPASTFEKQPDGKFSKSTEKVQKPATKSVGRPKKESIPDAGKPWAGLAGVNVPNLPETATIGQSLAAPVGYEANIHGVVIADSEIQFPGDPESPKPEENRLPTETEAKNIRARLIVVKEKGYSGLGQWILKVSGKPRTNDIPYSEAIKLVEQVEAAEKDGTLANLLK